MLTMDMMVALQVKGIKQLPGFVQAAAVSIECQETVCATPAFAVHQGRCYVAHTTSLPIGPQSQPIIKVDVSDSACGTTHASPHIPRVFQVHDCSSLPQACSNESTIRASTVLGYAHINTESMLSANEPMDVTLQLIPCTIGSIKTPQEGRCLPFLAAKSGTCPVDVASVAKIQVVLSTWVVTTPNQQHPDEAHHTNREVPLPTTMPWPQSFAAAGFAQLAPSMLADESWHAIMQHVAPDEWQHVRSLYGVWVGL